MPIIQPALTKLGTGQDIYSTSGGGGGNANFQVVPYNSTNFPSPSYSCTIGPGVPVGLTQPFSLTQGHTYTITIAGVSGTVQDTANGAGFSVYVVEGFSAPGSPIHNMGYIPSGSSGRIFSFTTTFTSQTSSTNDALIMIVNNSSTTNQVANITTNQFNSFAQDWGTV